MIDPPEIALSQAQQAAVIRITIPRAEIGTVMGPAMGELVRTVTEQGIGPAGPLFSYHFRMEPATFDFYVGVPVSGPVTPAGRVVAGELPGARVARTVYTGPYEGLGAAWGEFEAWIGEQGHDRRPDLWERYLAGPETGPDASTYRTELNHPLRD